MKKFNYQTGRAGEEIARRFLRKKGYRILESNFHTRFGEIDLICSENRKLVFVEVKLKMGEKFGSPEEMISKRKILQIQTTSRAFLQERQKLDQNYSSYRIDAVAIVLNKDKTVSRINHYQNIGFDL